MTDLDGNGLVDGSELSAYQLFNDGNPITITNRGGRTFSDATSRSWNIIAGAQVDDGFLVLRARQTRRRGMRYQTWSTDETGTINGRSRGWRDGQYMADQGLENIFNLDLNKDGLIGDQPPEEPDPINDGTATFAIEGTPQLGQVLSISLTNSDPDGDGTPTVAWLASNQDGTWSQVGSDPQITISADLEGRQLRANVSYVDGEGFSEDVATEPVHVPISNSDDYGATPDSSGSLAIGSSLEGNIESVGDLDWFKVELEADKYYNFELTGTTLEDSFLALKEANGNIISTDDDGGDGFNSRIIISPESSGTFYLEASAYNNERTGTYLITADEADALPTGYSPENGFGHVDAKRSFEKLLGISLDDAADLGGDLWGLDNIRAPEVWSGSNGFSGATGSGTVIAVVDTGVDLDHPEFQDRITQGFDFVDYDNIADDGDGHGTHVAGTIAGADDGEGITGVAPDASIMPIRVLDDEGYGYISDIIAGIRWAADNDADVINLSLGGGG